MKNKAVLGCGALLILMPLSVAWSAWVLSILWGWHVVPLLGAPKLGWAAAFGVSLTFSALRGFESSEKSRDSEDKSFASAMVYALVVSFGRPALALFLGWLIR